MRIAAFLSQVLIILFTQTSFAATPIDFGPDNSKIGASIKYSVVGNYHAEFAQYQGTFLLNERDNSIESVVLTAQVKSIHSSFPALDRIVRSKQILDSEKFPTVTFQSETILKGKKDYEVKGLLDLHGVKKEFVSPFTFDIMKDEKTGEKSIVLKGKWVLKRKEYGIIWNKLLDHGGIIVGDYMTVDWAIKTPLKTIAKD